MNNGWTGGQYSLARAVFGLYLLVHFAHLAPWAAETFSSAGVLADGSASPFLRLFPNMLAVADGPAFVTAFVASAIPAAFLLMIGCFDRVAAIWIWYVLACLFGRNPLTLNPSLPFAGWLLLVHCCLPAAPFGSWRARDRVDPDGGWRYPPALFGALWIVMAVAYSYSGYTKLISPSWADGTAIAHVLENPLARPTVLREWLLAAPPGLLHAMTWGGLALEFLFAPLALFRFWRPVIWLLMLMMHFTLIVLIDFADLSLGMVMLHLFTFDPAWVKPMARSASRRTTDTIFYDGHCGLCHRSIRFMLAEERNAAFQFAPLQGPTFETSVPENIRQGLPDSIVVWTHDKRVLARSSAIVFMLKRSGGWWRVLGHALGMIPRPLRDLGYNFVAKIRYRIFGTTDEACPLMPNHARSRFQA